MKIDKVTAINDELQLVHVTISHGSDSYKYNMNTPVLEGDALQAHCDSVEFKHLNNILYQVYDRNIQFSSEADWDEWVSDGCKIAEVKGTDADGEEITIKAEETIAKKAWVDSEPPVDQATLIADLQAKVKALEDA
tara:strand:+ start:94 stop:501 length:408 start_codon:yes stop_codon:yes gene_type:complete